MAEEIVLYLTHKIDKWVIKEFNNLKDTAGGRQVILLYHGEYDGQLPTPNFCFSDEDLWELGYPTMGGSLIPGQTHFPLFRYFKEKNNSADYYWLVEYDVRFTGEWSYLFDSFQESAADWISSLIRTYVQHPQWDWWELNHPTKYITKENRLASFNPIYRVSRKAIKFLDGAFLDGWKGHFEVSVPTLLNYEEFELQDFGGNGEFVKGRKNIFYINFGFLNHLYEFGTFRYRPIIDSAGLLKNKLYHPVKPESDAGLIRKLKYFRYRIYRRYGNDGKLF